MWAMEQSVTPYRSLHPLSSICNRAEARARVLSANPEGLPANWGEPLKATSQLRRAPEGLPANWGEPQKATSQLRRAPEGLPANWGEPPKGYQPIEASLRRATSLPGYLLIRDNSEQ